MKKKLVVLGCGILVMLSLAGYGESYTCAVCGTETREAYYDADGDIEYPMCKDCARDYWAPLPYTNFRIK